MKIPVSDYTNGFRFFIQKNAAEHVVLNCGKIGDGFIVLSEILLALHLNKFKIVETSTIFRNRIRGDSSVNFKLVIKSLIGLHKLYLIKNKKMFPIINKNLLILIISYLSLIIGFYFQENFAGGAKQDYELLQVSLINDGFNKGILNFLFNYYPTLSLSHHLYITFLLIIYKVCLAIFILD